MIKQIILYYIYNENLKFTKTTTSLRLTNMNDTYLTIFFRKYRTGHFFFNYWTFYEVLKLLLTMKFELGIMYC